MDLLINTYGTRIRSSGERIVLKFPKRTSIKEYSIRSIKRIVILRPSSISANAVKLALDHNIDIVFLGDFGKPIGRVFPSAPKGIAKIRRGQLEVANSPQSFEIAKQLVMGKIRNQLAFLRLLSTSYHRSIDREIDQVGALIKAVQLEPKKTSDRQQLLGIEGAVAVRYFAALKKLHRFPGRRPRGRDKFNCALNYGYGILYNEVERACLYVGLDPYLGLYHTERYGKPALVIDLIEEFRVPVVDSTIVPLFIDKQFSRRDFIQKKPGQYQLSVEGKRKIVEAIYHRFNQKVNWYGETITVQQVIGDQPRILANIFLGRTREYKPFDFILL